MHYADGAFWRPLFETNMELLQVASGCSHNRCRFCDMYRDGFRVSPREEVEEDLQELAASGTQVPRIFLAGGDALAIPQEDLAWTLRRIHELLPQVRSVGCFARVTDVARKTDDQLAQLTDLGLSRISIGAESGYDPALDFMRKGFRAADIVKQCARLDAAGLTYAFFYLIGMAGKGQCVEAARATVQTFSQVNPDIIMVHTMTPFSGTPLWDDIREGRFEQAPEREILQELREFVSAYPKRTYLLGYHVSNVVRLQGTLPDQAQQMLPYLDKAIADLAEDQMESFRSSLTSI
ncbi:MAG: radical SAM protein [Parafannyhessea sp.]|uniref:radical SAM protein n=1 Tax=Parafannyhessea sp. TaxID=2847324 RepID=UPI003F063951